jgi:transcription elongation GreA/GreB family factor
MSVAFRRDSDEEHLEPRFELPIPPGPNLVTERGLELITARVAELEAALPPVSDVDARKAALRDLRYWRQRLATAELRPPPSGDQVRFGSQVRYRLGGKDNTVTIVGHDEADPANRLLSFLAPLSRALLGAQVGEELDFGGKEAVLEVLAIG